MWNQTKKKKNMEFEFHVKFLTLLDFLKIEFFIETQFLENRVSKHGYFATSFERKGQMPILPWKTKSVQKVKNHPYPQNLRSSNYCVAHVS